FKTGTQLSIWHRTLRAQGAYSAWSRARFHADGGRHSSRSRAAVQAIAGSVPDDGGQNSILIAGSCSCAG
ncbi:MAG TPA: hypothetical protein PLH47_11140, partial [Ottowia sp.]|nr:hypothetical protein [Ottowia sp.]HQZ57417.1 hypothetical protein [Ottowia sp.]HRB10720.1 hypothetical protein [Ottowia sp.]